MNKIVEVNIIKLMIDDLDEIYGFKVKIGPGGIVILVDYKPTEEESESMTNFVCGYLIEEGFFDKTEIIRVEIVRRKK